ncbi:MAG TPA: YtxH domain-containing protein [Nitrospiraceae bacterium]|nr:YtxH domain-containing protein [Nitrospiraceae bacterium]
MESSGRYESGNPSAFVTFITGALVGAGVALLFAPQSGSRTRRLLRDHAARANDEFDEAIDRGGEFWDQAVERGQEFVEKGKESLRETARQARGFAAAGRPTDNDAKDELAS